MAEGGKSGDEIAIRNLEQETRPQSVFVTGKTGGSRTQIHNAMNVQVDGTMTVFMGVNPQRRSFKAKKPLTTSTDLITLDQMLNIQSRLGQDWKDLGRRLKCFDEAELEQLYVEHRDNLRELNYQIILECKRRKPGEATQANFAKVFLSMGRGDLADLLLEDVN
uniref:Death domain-containing protein n=1 Tax=Arion vulgaris TaxID=1028688 RepID=A0A0B7BVU8_9EUPU